LKIGNKFAEHIQLFICKSKNTICL
jgi:hypothetical protein